METTSIHGGKLTFSEPRHQYHWNDTRVKHTVSGICGEGYPLPFGVPAGWAAKMIRLDLVEAVQQQQASQQFGKFTLEQIEEAPISAERLVYHPDFEYAGKLDLFVELQDGSTAVIDYKGVTDLKYAPKPGHVGQGAAYCMALRLENIRVDSFILMEVERETGKLRVTRYDDLEREFEAFVWALNLVRYKPAGTDIT